MALRHRQSRAARRGAAGGHRGGDIPTATPSRHLPAAGTQPCGGRTRSRLCAVHRGHRWDTPVTNTRPWGTRGGPCHQPCRACPKRGRCPHRATPDPRGHRGAGGFWGDSMKPRGWCHRSSGSANHPGSKSSSCCWGVLKEDQVGDPVALSIAPGLSPALGMAPALCWAPGSPRQSCSPVLHLQADAAELQPALCTSATSFNLGQEEQSPAFPMGMYCIPGLLCSLPG